MEQQVCKCQGMVERGLNANHMMITELTNKHKIDANEIGKHLSSLYDRIDHLQAQIYDLQNQNCELAAGGRMKAKAGSRAGGSRLAVKKSKADKDPNKPKRPPSAFFVFMDTFRKEYREKHPDVKLASVIGKAGGEKWKSLSDAEKAPYNAKAEKLKAEYTKKINAYNNPQAGEASGDSDKSKSEVNDEDDGSEGDA
ncbi:HMG1/2-like protein [Hordeum vulgare]|nr:HMG1/2-like protein [Hordeum vulgare]